MLVWCLGQLQAQRALVIHCQKGKNRSAAIAAGLLMLVNGTSWHQSVPSAVL